MCLATSPIGGVVQGPGTDAVVVFDTVVPAQRPVVGGKRSYEIDVREFVVTDRNALIARTLANDVALTAAKLDPKHGRERLMERHAGCFDFRVQAVVGWVLQNVRYRAKDGRDPWQFPDETLALRSGDCEDIAFLAAALLLASGVSGYHVRVALGHVRDSRGNRWDHAWVLYKSEAGTWRLVEPLAARHGGAPPRQKPVARGTGRRPVRRPESLTYHASYVFNADHLWAIPHADHPGSFERVAKKAWSRMNPKFAGDVHRRIVEAALEDVASTDLMAYLRGRFRNLAVATIDQSDWVNPLDPSSTPYDPRDHFDNGCIDAGWDLVQSRLSAFASSAGQDFESFAGAIHGIADFYAHSSYVRFAWIGGSPTRSAKPYPGPKVLAENGDDYFHDAPSYGPPEDPALDGNFDLRRFSMNRSLWRGSVDEGVAKWDGKIVSGRYAQDTADAMGSFLERNIEKLSQMPARWAQPERGALPHHDEIAVDDADPSGSHALFRDPSEYRMQFQWRFDTAVRHIRQAFQNNTAF